MEFESADSDVGYTVKYYCTRCEDFFELSPIAPLRCPMCFCDARYILGPMKVKDVDIDKLTRKRYKKYQGKMSK